MLVGNVGVFFEHFYKVVCFFLSNTVLGEKSSEVEPRGAGSNLRECHLAAGQEEGC